MLRTNVFEFERMRELMRTLAVQLRWPTLRRDPGYSDENCCGAGLEGRIEHTKHRGWWLRNMWGLFA